MPLQTFSFPFPETRLIKAGNFIYKFKIRGGSSYSGEDGIGGNSYKQELEEIIRAVLGNLGSLQPFSSTHFNVFPYKKHWEGASKVIHCERNLRAYPFILILYLEKNTQNGQQAEDQLSPEQEVAQKIPRVCEPQPKRCKTDSPLEEAILKDLVEDFEAESKIFVVRLHENSPHAGEEAREDPGPADKKGPMRFDEAQQKSCVNVVGGSGTPGEVPPGTMQDTGEEEEEEDEEEEEKEDGDEERENANSARQTPVKPGILARLASHIFPFSLFFRDP